MRLSRSAFVVLALALLGPASLAAQGQEPLAAGSEGVPVPKKKKHVQPVYPKEALAQGIRGIVILDLVIDTEGRVAETSIIRSIPGLDEAALVAASQWVYSPVKVNGEPVSVRLTVPITFALKLPEMSRQPGIPQLRQGVTPPWPTNGSPGGGKAVADVTLESDGRIGLARILEGEEPWSTALLQALRTWRFSAPPDDVSVSFQVAAEFQRGGGRDGKGQIRLDLRGLREAALFDEPTEPQPVATAQLVPEPTPPATSTAPATAEPQPLAAPPAEATAPSSDPTIAPPPQSAPGAAPPGAAPPGAAPPGAAPPGAAPPGAAPSVDAPPADAPPADAPPADAPPADAPPADAPPADAPPADAPPADAPPADAPPADAPPADAPPAASAPASSPAPADPPAVPAGLALARPAGEANRPAPVSPQAPGGPAPPPAGEPAAPPPIETLSVAPPPLPPENGISAIRGVELEPGVPDLTRGRRPVSPPLARMAGANGVVEVDFSVSAGGVTSVQRADGPEVFQAAATGSVESWLFRRTRADRAYLTAVFTYEDDLASAVVRPQPAR